MTTIAKKHQHKYIKVRDDRISLWRCAAPDCNFSLYEKQAIMLLGRTATCWTCDKPFRLKEENLKEDLPICMECRYPGVDDAIEQLIADAQANK